VSLLQTKRSGIMDEALASMLKEHPTLKSLCGNKGDETELDMSSKGMDDGDAIMLIAEIVDNGALIKLDISNNHIRSRREQHLQHICVAGGIKLAGATAEEEKFARIFF
jgi:hypothetical protein